MTMPFTWCRPRRWPAIAAIEFCRFRKGRFKPNIRRYFRCFYQLLDPQFPENLPKVTALCWSLLPLYVLLVFRLLRQWGLSQIEAAGICALTALSPHVVLSGLMTMSELAFGVLLMTTLLLERSMTKAGVAITALAGLAGGLAFLTRTQGIALLISAAVVLPWRKRWLQDAVFSLVFGVFAAGWFLWTHAHAYAGADPVTIYYVDYGRFYLASVHWIDIPDSCRPTSTR